MPKIKPVKAWAISDDEGPLVYWSSESFLADMRERARNWTNQLNNGRTYEVVRVEIRVLPKRKKVSR